ncbi:atp-dependent helicase [Fusarium acutatum]|uniref:Atp-dependent helicase n=1 Tax=Fusarium acutatum TaxID=78861 RepID=A0A8H4J983_9HYPO|nr:atp-dependent helicase [Fusarium acutatum]
MVKERPTPVTSGKHGWNSLNDCHAKRGCAAMKPAADSTRKLRDCGPTDTEAIGDPCSHIFSTHAPLCNLRGHHSGAKFPLVHKFNGPLQKAMLSPLDDSLNGNAFMPLRLQMRVIVCATSVRLLIAVFRRGFPRYVEPGFMDEAQRLSVATTRAIQAESVLMHPAIAFRSRQGNRVPTDYTSKEDAEYSPFGYGCFVTSRPTKKCVVPRRQDHRRDLCAEQLPHRPFPCFSDMAFTHLLGENIFLEIKDTRKPLSLNPGDYANRVRSRSASKANAAHSFRTDVRQYETKTIERPKPSQTLKKAHVPEGTSSADDDTYATLRCLLGPERHEAQSLCETTASPNGQLAVSHFLGGRGRADNLTATQARGSHSQSLENAQNRMLVRATDMIPEVEAG